MKQHIILVLMWTKARKLQDTQDPLPPPSGSLFFSKSELLGLLFPNLISTGFPGKDIPLWIHLSLFPPSLSLSPPTPSFPLPSHFPFLNEYLLIARVVQVLGKQQWSCLGSWAVVWPPPRNFLLLWITYYGCKFAYQMASPHSSSRYVMTVSPGN